MAATWKVTNQRQQEELTAGGQFRTVIIVSFETIPSGTVGSVTIPKAQYGPEFVASAIDEYVKNILAVESL